MDILKNTSLLAYNTFGIEVSTACLVRIEEKTVLSELIKVLPSHPQPVLVVGGGSNLLFTQNFEGTILLVQNKGIDVVRRDAETVIVKAASGENWDEFVNYCVDAGFGGLENLTAIPGTVGASPVQNIGAYGTEVCEVIHAVEALELETGISRIFTPGECEFGYRSSIFKHELKDQYLVTSVSFLLSTKPAIRTDYGAIAAELERLHVTQPSIKNIRDAVRTIRESKLPDPHVLGNAGSFFKNPVVTEGFFEFLKEEHPDMVHFNLPDGDVKLAAGWLIEQCGWKGKKLGNAAVHDKQALIIVNYRNASGKEIMALAEEITASVFEKFSVVLEPEVNII
jgi:UDP-N-acetylmuramate dehydrogenase